MKEIIKLFLEKLESLTPQERKVIADFIALDQKVIFTTTPKFNTFPKDE